MLNITLNTTDHEPNRGDVRLNAPLRAFESGAEGYFAGGKVVIDGQTFQVSCNVIRVGSKDEPEAEQRREDAMRIKLAKAARRKAATGDGE